MWRTGEDVHVFGSLTVPSGDQYDDMFDIVNIVKIVCNPGRLVT